MYKTLKMMIVNKWFAVLGDFKFQMICFFSLSLSFMVIILNEEFSPVIFVLIQQIFQYDINSFDECNVLDIRSFQ